MVIDKDTQKILTEADHVKSMIDSEGWKSVYDKLSTKLLDLQNIYNLDMSDVSTINVQLAARKMAVETITAWLKADVFGFVEQQQANNQKMVDAGIESFIGRE